MTPRENNYSMPAEWGKHECCWMQWPHDNPDFKGYGGIPSWSHFDIEKGRAAWANVARAISEFEKVKMIVHPDNIENAKKLLSPKIEIIEFINDDGWARDSGAIFLLNNEKKLIYMVLGMTVIFFLVLFFMPTLWHNDGLHSPDHIPLQNGEVFKETVHDDHHHGGH